MENKFIRADDVAQELSVSKPYAYTLIRKLNVELKAQGFITIAGRVNRQYFYERLYGAGKRVLDEAKKALNVQSVKEGSQWYWQLPEKIK